MFSLIKKSPFAKNFHTSAFLLKQNKKAKEAKKAAKSKTGAAAETPKETKKKKQEETSEKKAKALVPEKKEKKEHVRPAWDRPVCKPYLQIPSGDHPSYPIKDYIGDIQIINFDNKTGFFSYPELSDPFTLKRHQISLFEELNVLVNLNVAKMNAQEFFKHIVKMDSMIDDLAWKCQLISRFHSHDDFITVSNTILNLVEAFVEQNLVPKYPEFYSKLHSHLSEYSGEALLQANKRIELYKSRGAHFSMEQRVNFAKISEKFTSKVDELRKVVKEMPNIEVPSPSRLYDIPRDTYHEILKKKVNKKRTALLNHEQADIAVKFSHNPIILKDILNKSRAALFDKSSTFHTVLPEFALAAKEYATTLGYKNIFELKQAQHDLDAQEALTLINNLKLAIGIDHICANVKKVKPSSEPQDFAFSVSEFYRMKQKYRDTAHQEFMSIPSILNALNEISGEVFGISLKESKLAVGESWGPKTIKKFVLTKDGKDLGIVYLDLFSRQASNKGKRPSVTQHGKIAVISADFGENVMEIPTTLTVEQMQSIIHLFSQVVYGFSVSVPNPFISHLFARTMELFAFDASFLKRLKHFTTNVPMLNEYVDEVVSQTSLNPYDTFREIYYSLVDSGIFAESSQDFVGVFKINEGKLFEREHFPAWNSIANLGGDFYLDLYSRVLAAQIWNTNKDFKEFFTVGTTKQVLNRLLKNQKSSVDHFVKELKF